MNATKRGQRLKAWLAATEAAITKGTARPKVPGVPVCWHNRLDDAMMDAARFVPAPCGCRDGCSNCDGAELDAVREVRQVLREQDVRKKALLERVACHLREDAAFNGGKASGMALLRDHCGHDVDRVNGMISAELKIAHELRLRAARLDARAGCLHV